MGPTNPGFVYSHIEGIDQVFKEHANQTEIDSSDTPRSIDQDDNICDGRSCAYKLIHWIMRDRQRNRKRKSELRCTYTVPHGYRSKNIVLWRNKRTQQSAVCECRYGFIEPLCHCTKYHHRAGKNMFDLWTQRQQSTKAKLFYSFNFNSNSENSSGIHTG